MRRGTRLRPIFVSLTLATALVGGEAHPAAAQDGPRRGMFSRGAARRDDASATQRDGARATQVRQLGDRLSSALRSPRVETKRYALQHFEPDVEAIFATVEELQRAGTVSPTEEHRAIAAAGRVLYAAAMNGAEVDEALVDRYDTLASRAKYKRVAPRHETAVEIETTMTAQILDALTTKDGTLAPLLAEGGKPVPEVITRLARGGRVEDLKWDRLDRTQKLELLRSQSKGRSFFADRKIPGMKFRRELAKPFLAKVELGGKTTGIGTKVSVDGVLMEKVEYMGPTNVDDVSGVEMHIRQPGRASRNAKDAFTVVDLVGSSAKQGHEHIPARIPTRVLKGDALARASLVDFYRRVNMVGELKSVLEGYSLQPVKTETAVYFDFLKADGLAELDAHLASIGQGRGPRLGESDLKMGAVGFRTGEIYGDEMKFGFEVRVLTKDRAQQGDAFVDAIQKGVLTGGYGLPNSTLRKVLVSKLDADKLGHPPTVYDEGQVLASLHYNRDVSSLLAAAPEALKVALTVKVGNRIKAEGDKFYGLKMLAHDWSQDPALAGNAAAQAKVLEAQKLGLAELGAGGKPTTVVKDFVARSGLLEVFAESIGMNDPVVKQ